MRAEPVAIVVPSSAAEGVSHADRLSRSMKSLHGASRSSTWLEGAINRLDNRSFGSPSVDDLSRILYRCIKEKKVSCTLRLHAYLQDFGLEIHPSLANSLILALVGIDCMYAAQNVFDNLVQRENCSWNSLIAGYGRSGYPNRAISLYRCMREDASKHLSDHAFVALLKACCELQNIVIGCQIHAEIVEKGLLEKNIFIASALLDMYAKCGFLSEAQAIFDAVPVRDAVLWTALIAAYAESGFNMEALSCFRKMQLDMFSPDATTFVCCLKACKGARFITRGEEIFADAVRKALETEPIVGNVIIDMYSKCGMLAEAHFVFNNQTTQTEASWNVIMTSSEEMCYHEETLQCFMQMQINLCVPDTITYACCLKACGGSGVREKGQELHVGICRQGLETDIAVTGALIDMYTKCGCLLEAQAVFDKLYCQDLVSWTALIAGYAQYGQLEKACSMFKRMIESGLKPNLMTFVSLLTACNHSGVLESGELWLNSMCKAHDMTPLHAHYACLIDLFGRAGFLQNAMAIIQNMPIHPGVEVWHAFMSVCQRWGDIKVGSIAFNYSIELVGNDVGAYVCMSNSYAMAGMQTISDWVTESVFLFSHE